MTACRHCAKPIEWRQIATAGDGKPVEKWVAVGERRHHPQQGSTYVCQYDDERRFIVSYHEPQEATP